MRNIFRALIMLSYLCLCVVTYACSGDGETYAEIYPAMAIFDNSGNHQISWHKNDIELLDQRFGAGEWRWADDSELVFSIPEVAEGAYQEKTSVSIYKPMLDSFQLIYIQKIPGTDINHFRQIIETHNSDVMYQVIATGLFDRKIKKHEQRVKILERSEVFAALVHKNLKQKILVTKPVHVKVFRCSGPLYVRTQQEADALNSELCSKYGYPTACGLMSTE